MDFKKDIMLFATSKQDEELVEFYGKNSKVADPKNVEKSLKLQFVHKYIELFTKEEIDEMTSAIISDRFDNVISVELAADMIFGLLMEEKLTDSVIVRFFSRAFEKAKQNSKQKRK